MALAYLWTQLRLNRPSYNPYVRGFVIDHGLRPDSAEEAQLVASRLEPLLGKPGHVITLNWDKYGNPKHITAKETVARKLRFRALAEAARNWDLQAILLGHHADDNVETSICRITTSARGSGLIGIKGVANIPECFGLYGVDGSGAFNRLSSHSTYQHYIGGPESGGITIGRPLLEFPKSRLVATCEKAGIGWVEDKTNQDVSLTPRNAVRWMLKHDLLPMALRSENILGMIANINEKSREIKTIAQKFHELSQIKSLDLRSGVMEVYLPTNKFAATLLENYPNEQDIFQGFAEYFYSLAEAVHPSKVLKMSLTIRSARILFEELMGKKHSIEKTKNNLSFCKIIVKRLDSLMINGEPHTGLRLHRSPFSENKNSDRPESIVLPSLFKNIGHEIDQDSLQLPSSNTDARQGTKHKVLRKIDNLLLHPVTANAGDIGKRQKLPGTDDTHLWDGRFWISIQNYSPVPLRLEALNEDKMAYFRSTMYGYHWNTYLDLFKEAAPESARWTLPAIICEGLPPVESMIPPNQKVFYNPARTRGKTIDKASLPEFEIFKYSTEPMGRRRDGDGVNSRVAALPGKVQTIVPYSLDPSDPPTTGDAALSKRSSANIGSVFGFSSIPVGRVNAETYPKPSGPFIVAIPTMQIFLNHYWAKRLKYDIRYRRIALTDMEYVTRYRMEKPIMVDGLRKDFTLPKVVGERLGTSSSSLFPPPHLSGEDQ